MVHSFPTRRSSDLGAAGIGTLDTYAEEGLLTRGASLEAAFESAIHALKGAPHVIDVRNIGLMAAVELEPRPGKPGARAYEAFLKCFEAGVLVRSTGWLDPTGWAPADHAYMQSETQAALLACLTGLSCPVINRASASLWYRPRNPLLGWLPLLRRCGLPAPETILTDDPATFQDRKSVV